MLCFRCGSHVKDGAVDCWNCGSDLSQRKNAPTSDLRARQRTGSRIFGVVHKIGDVIADRYTVKDIVGSGGAGVVYRTVDRQVDVDVAVKVINGKLVQAVEDRDLLAQQVQVARTLNHQNCVRIYDAGIDAERPYLAMQFLEGLSLRRIIDLRREKGQVFTPAEVEPIFNQLCQALDYTHRTTLHGNLKPDNVIVLPDLLKITDFGLLLGLPRKPFLALQKARGHNFRYLAPEVRLEVTDLDPTVDVFSLGVILIEMLTGHVYDDARPEALDLALAALRPETADALRRAVGRAPQARFGSALDVHQALLDCIQAAEAEARPTVDGEVPVEPVRSAPPAAPRPAKPAHDAPTQRLDIDEHGERPVQDEPVAGPADVSTTYQIDDGMIEAESSARSHEAHAASPFDDEDLIDNPSGGTIDLDEEETLALDEPSAEIQAVRAEVEARLGGRARSMLEEISNSNIQLIDDPTTKGANAADSPPPPEVSSPAAPAPADLAAASQRIPSDAAADGHRARAAGAPHTESASANGRATELCAEPTARAAEAGPTAGGAEPTVSGADAGPPTGFGAEPTVSAAEAGSPTGPGAEPTVSGSQAGPAPGFGAEPTVSGADAGPAPGFGGEPTVSASGNGSAAGLGAAGARGRGPARGPGVEVTPKDQGEASRTAARSEAVSAASRGLATAVGFGSAQRIATALAAELANDESASPPSVPSRAPSRPRVHAPNRGQLPRFPSTQPWPSGGANGRAEVRAGPTAAFERSEAPASSSVRSGAAGPARPAKERPMTRPRIAVPSPPPSASWVKPTVAPVAVEGPPGTAAPPASNRLVYFTVAASFVLIVTAFIVVVKMNIDQQRRTQAEMAAFREQVLRESRAAEAARAKEQAALLEAAQRALAARQAAADVDTADEAAERSAKARRDAEAAAAKKEAAARRLRADAAAARDRESRQRAEREAKAAAEDAKRSRALAVAEARRGEESRRKKAEAEAARARAEQERRAAEARAQKEREAALVAEANAKRLRAARTPIQPRGADEGARAATAASSERTPIRPGDRPSGTQGATGPRGPATAVPAAVTAARLPADEPPRLQCPKGMKLIEGGAFMMGSLPTDPERNFGDLDYASVEVAPVCMDYYEYPNGRGRKPSAGVTWKTAADRCRRRGKRLCTEAEWERACKGPTGLRYAYGNRWDPGRCNTEDEEGNDRTATPSGEFSKCRSRYGIIDMAGNLAEWTATAQGSRYVVKGGGADRPGYDSRCAARSRKKASHTSELVGFRCCKDPS